MLSSNQLTADSLDQLERRSEIGVDCILLAHGGEGELLAEERETYAKDAISDILTALFGAAGSYVANHDGETGLIPERFALNEARRLVEEAFESWTGDAEDYTREIEDESGGHH